MKKELITAVLFVRISRERAEDGKMDESKPNGKRGAPKRFTALVREAFLKRYAETGLVTITAKELGFSDDVVHLQKKQDPEFEIKMKLAYRQFQNRLEQEALRRAAMGVDEPVFQGGELVGTKRVYSDRLMELMLKRHIPEFRDKQQLDVNVTGGVLIVPGSLQNSQEWEASLVEEPKELEDHSKRNGSNNNGDI